MVEHKIDYFEDQQLLAWLLLTTNIKYQNIYILWGQWD